MRINIALLLVLVLTASSLLVTNSAFSYADIVEDSWTPKAPLPQGKSNLGLAVVNGKIYAIGGTIRNYLSGWAVGYSGTYETVNTNYAYDSEADKWITGPHMPTARHSFATVVYGNSIYCLGGSYDVGPFPWDGMGVTNAVEVLNLTTNKWESKTPMPTRRSKFATMLYEDNIYCIGEGINEVYNIATDTWQTKAAMPFNGSTIMANAVNGKLYLTFDSLIYVYNPATDSWTTKSSIQNENYGTVSAVIGNKIYFISVNLTQIYDTETDEVSSGAALHPDYIGNYIGDIAISTTGEIAPERIYVLDVVTQLTLGIHHEFQVYNPESDSWTIGAKMATARIGVGCVLVDDKIYAIGGNTATRPPGVPHYYPDISVTQYATNMEYTPFGYGSVSPKVTVFSPESQNYIESSVSLAFAVNRPVVWMGYSLDGQDNVTIAGNTTLSNLPNDSHNLIVYVKDQAGKTGASEIIDFNIIDTFPSTLIIASVSTIIVVFAIFVYFKKSKHQTENYKR